MSLNRLLLAVAVPFGLGCLSIGKGDSNEKVVWLFMYELFINSVDKKFKIC